MSWTCYSCQTINSDKEATCIKCGGTVAAQKKFYLHWVFIGALFFMITFILGTYLGGVLMALSDSAIYQATILRLLPAILFVVCGIIIGFASEAITILEAGLAAILGQGIAVGIFIYLIGESPIGWMDFLIGAIPGALLATLGAWIGEKIQYRKEQAGGITG